MQDVKERLRVTRQPIESPRFSVKSPAVSSRSRKPRSFGLGSRFLGWCLAALAALWMGSAQAVTLNVPSTQYPTIQSAVNAAQPGDLVLVAAGYYWDCYYNAPGDTVKSVVVMKSGITLRGAGTGRTIVDPNLRGRGITCAGVTNATIRDLTVRRAAAAVHGAGIYCTAHSNPTIRNCEVIDCQSTGILCNHGSSPTIESCQINGNIAPGNGGGLLIDQSSPQVRSCVIQGDGSDGDGAGVWCWGDSSAPVFSGCDVSWNTVLNDLQDAGAGFWLGRGHPTITDTVIEGDYAGWAGGGIYAQWCQLTLTNCRIVQNRTRDGLYTYGAGLLLLDSQGSTIQLCTVAHNLTYNDPEGSGGGIALINSTGVIVRQCTIADNAATYGGGVYVESTSGTLDHSIVAFSTCGQGIACQNSPNFTSTCNDFYGNTGGNNFACQGNGTNNFTVDPQFCDPANDNFYLQPSSPCVNYGACGMVGYPGVGCATAVAQSILRATPELWSAPNPFHTSTTIRFALDRSQFGSLRVFDAAGRQVRLLEQGGLAAGPHQVIWDGRDGAGERVASGVYFFRLNLEGARETRRVILVP